jgi:hypothetical protein
VHRAVIEDLVVDLVGEQQQMVPPGQLDQLLEQLGRVHGAGGVVRVDDDQRPGAIGDLRGDVGRVGEPAGLLVAAVVHRVPAAEADRGRP